MKKLYSLISIFLFCASMYAQTPQAINYQGLARDNAGNVLVNQNISLRLSVLSGSITGTPVYVETHTTTADANGLFALQIGQGTIVSGAFNSINWGSNTYYLKVEIDPSGGTGYILVGTNQFASVPYSLHSANGVSKGQNPGDMLYWNGTQWLPIPVGSEGQVLRISGGIPTWDSNVQFASIITTPISGISMYTATSGGNISDGGAPVEAKGVCWNTLSGPTTVDNTTSDGTGPGSFTSSITGLASATTYYLRAYAINSKGTAYGDEHSFTTAEWQCGSSVITVNHAAAGGVAPVNKSVSYGTVADISGEPDKCWITQNLGSDQPASDVSDATEASAGWYWQFNRKQGYKHDGTTYTPATTWTSSIDENSDWLPDYDPCTLELGSVWRLPTSSEWTNVDESGSWTNWNGPWNSGLKLHAAGYIDGSTGLLAFRGLSGYVWSSKQYDATGGWSLDRNGSFCDMGVNGKTYGFSVRCISGATISTTTVTTSAITGITASTASSGGNVECNMGISVTARGVCWSPFPGPTVETSNKTINGSGSGSFTSDITGLAEGSTYYLRAYATNSFATVYGNEISFTTLALPTITTTAIASITTTVAASGGNISYDGGSAVTARGVCWSTSPNPTIALSTVTTDGTGSGSFTSNISGLTLETTYYVRAYATNSVGTAYGNQVSFTHLLIGQGYQGGIIAYIFQPGDPVYIEGETHGLIAATTEQGTAEWGCTGTVINGADGLAIGTGYQNTLDIVASCSTETIAAKICSDLVLNGYNDWFLPSKDELTKLYINRIAIGSFVGLWYWSSSEATPTAAFYYNFNDGYTIPNGKHNPIYIRAVRTF